MRELGGTGWTPDAFVESPCAEAEEWADSISPTDVPRTWCAAEPPPAATEAPMADTPITEAQTAEAPILAAAAAAQAAAAQAAAEAALQQSTDAVQTADKVQDGDSTASQAQSDERGLAAEGTIADTETAAGDDADDAARISASDSCADGLPDSAALR